MSRTGLNAAQCEVARSMAVGAASLLLHHADVVHYTQGSARWEGIDHNLKAWRGQFPHFADCSAAVTWELWNGMDHFHLPDSVNGEHWRAGYTGTLLTHGKSVLHQPLKLADAVLYGFSPTGDHTALYVGGGMVISHGSEAGPFLEPVRYRPDLRDIRRYIF